MGRRGGRLAGLWWAAGVWVDDEILGPRGQRLRHRHRPHRPPLLVPGACRRRAKVRVVPVNTSVRNYMLEDIAEDRPPAT